MNITDSDHQRLLERPVEPDVQILSMRYRRMAGIPFLLEEWNWEGIQGSTAVFLTKDVGGIDDADLQKFLTEQVGLDLGKTTIVRNEAYTFLNFGFEG